MRQATRMIPGDFVAIAFDIDIYINREISQKRIALQRGAKVMLLKEQTLNAQQSFRWFHTTVGQAVYVLTEDGQIFLIERGILRPWIDGKI